MKRSRRLRREESGLGRERTNDFLSSLVFGCVIALTKEAGNETDPFREEPRRGSISLCVVLSMKSLELSRSARPTTHLNSTFSVTNDLLTCDFTLARGLGHWIDNFPLIVGKARARPTARLS